MPRTSKLKLVLPEIEKHFNELPTKVFTTPLLVGEFIQNEAIWDLPKSQRFRDFVAVLLEESHLLYVKLECERYQDLDRFAWGTPSIFALALTVKNAAYLTHGSAMFLHKLTDGSPQTVYVNYEQSPKPQNGVLTQEGIHRAFARPQRQTNLVYKYEDYSIVVINGKHTGRYGVRNYLGEDGANPMDITDLERTLIDITVRPAYAGGVVAVLEAYRRAKDQIKVEKLLETLNTLNYIYPYHQAIGFFMEKAGYQKNQWSKLLKRGTKFDFYITHQLPETKHYDPKWRIYYPENLM